MSSKFHDQASYIAAFLAISVGLMIFRNDLAQIIINFGFFAVSLFWILVVFVSILVFATYVSALAVMSEQFNISELPLTKYIKNIANFLTAIGLLFPIVTALVYVIVQGVMAISAINQQLVGVLSLAITSLTLGMTAGRYVILRNKRQIEYNYALAESYIEKRTDTFTPRIYEAISGKKAHVSMYEFLEHYEYVTNYTKEYLRSLGYGVRSSSAGFIGKLLLSKKKIPEQLANDLQWVADLRNQAAHALHNPTSKETVRARGILEDLFQTVRPLFIELIDSTGKNS